MSLSAAIVAFTIVGIEAERFAGLRQDCRIFPQPKCDQG